MMEQLKGSVFNIEGYAVHDGPGIRTLVFLKGCPLSCLWCCNPESQKITTELLMFRECCIGCGACITSCPQHAITMDAGAGIITDKDKCNLCLACVDACYSNARRVYGTDKTVDEVVNRVEKDAAFYQTSGGGITVSGGEPFKQTEFCKAILKECKERCIHTAVETSGSVSEEKFLSVLPFVDVFLFDLKHMDSEVHQKLTGMSNELIHRNFDSVLKNGKEVIARMPLIPGLNDSTENIIATCNFLKSRGIYSINVLPYNQLGVNKYDRIGKQYMLGDIEPHSKEQLAEFEKLFEENGMECVMY